MGLLFVLILLLNTQGVNNLIPHLKPKPHLIIAVIDDGFRLTHNSLQPFIYTNKGDTAFDRIDNDNNGFINDYSGWDISDMDNNVQPTEHIIDDFYHGTFIAGTICDLAKKYLGVDAHQKIKILPIKVASDTGNPNRLLDGYRGIEYATKMGADIIVTAWNGGELTANKSNILSKAIDQGILIIAASGNEASARPSPPASYDDVVAVSALDKYGQKIPISNFGTHIDFSTLGESYKVPSSKCDTCYRIGINTSLSCALTAALAAILKVKKPHANNSTLINLIKQSCDELPNLPLEYKGKLGSGSINFNRAIAWATDSTKIKHNKKLTEGIISFNQNKSYLQNSFSLEGDSHVHQTNFILKNLSPIDEELQIFIKQNNILIANWSLDDLYKQQFIDGSNLEVFITAQENTTLDLAYQSIYLDSTNYYCEHLTIQNTQKEKKSISDGSGQGINYVNNSDCKWLIEAPDNFKITVDFESFSTEPKADFVYIFEGDVPLQTNMIAKFSGRNIPPSITSVSNSILIWFITDKQITSEGWILNFNLIPPTE